MRRILRDAALAASLLTLSVPALAQRGGRGNDSTGGRGAGLPMTPAKALKFTTGEGMGFVGRGEGVAALAVATLRE